MIFMVRARSVRLLCFVQVDTVSALHVLYIPTPVCFCMARAACSPARSTVARVLPCAACMLSVCTCVIPRHEIVFRAGRPAASRAAVWRGDNRLSVRYGVFLRSARAPALRTPHFLPG